MTIKQYTDLLGAIALTLLVPGLGAILFLAIALMWKEWMK